MAEPLIQQAFNAGEISPELYGEVSLQKYSSAATTLRNFIVNYKGGAMSRGGLAFVGRSKQSVSGTGPPRLYTFQFNITQGYILEFGDNYLRFIFQGGYVTESQVDITGATQADPCQISVTGEPFANGDWVFFAGVGGMTQLNGQTCIVANSAAGHFTLEDLNGNPLNSEGYGAYTAGGTVSRIYTVATPYQAVDLPYLKRAESADEMALACSNPVTTNEYPPYDLIREAGASWTLTATDFFALLLAPTRVVATSQSLAPKNGINATFAYQVTAVDVNGNESVASGTATCHGADLQTEAGTNNLSWAPAAGAVSYNIYRAAASVDTVPPSGDSTNGTPNPVPPGSIFGFVGSAFGNQFADTNTTPDLSQTPPTHQSPFARGQILAVVIDTGGFSLTNVTWSITTTDGVRFEGFAVVTGGAMGAFVITNPGELFEPGDSIAFNGAGFASGSIAFSGQPAANSTITLNGTVWTFVSSLTGSDQTLIGASLALTLQAVAANLNASTDANIEVANYAVDVSGEDLVITYGEIGTAGDSYTLAADAGSNGTPSGATLEGGEGTEGAGAPTGTLTVGPTSGTYPGVVAYFQGRRFWANSLNNPDTVWATQTGRYANMDVSDPTEATDAITASPWTEQVNGIQWLVPMPGGLIAMTGSRAWQILGEGSYQLNAQPITPSTVQAQPQAFNGCSATIEPFVENFDVIYVEAVSGTIVRDLSWNFWTNIYTGADLTILSSHLFLNSTLVQGAWARQPYRIAWYPRDDGTFLSLTYMKEQEVYGWSRHDTQGLVVSVASCTEPPVDATYMAVLRFPPYAPQGIYIIERMDNRLWNTVEDAYAVDSGVSNPMSSPSTFVYASAASGNGVTFTAGADTFSNATVGQILRMAGGIATITGYTNARKITGNWACPANNGAIGLPFASAGRWTLATPVESLSAPHLAGMTVSVLADGVPVPNIVVAADGTITWGFAASNVKAGLPFTAQLQTPYLNPPGPTAQGMRKVITSCTVRVASSAAFQMGTNQPDGAAQNPPQLAPAWSNLAPAAPDKPKTYQNPAGQTVTQLWTGDIPRVSVESDWNTPGQIAIQQSLPLALEITAIVPDFLEGDVPEQTYSPKPQGERQGARAPGRWMIR